MFPRRSFLNAKIQFKVLIFVLISTFFVDFDTFSSLPFLHSSVPYSFLDPGCLYVPSQCQNTAQSFDFCSDYNLLDGFQHFFLSPSISSNPPWICTHFSHPNQIIKFQSYVIQTTYFSSAPVWALKKPRIQFCFFVNRLGRNYY